MFGRHWWTRINVRFRPKADIGGSMLLLCDWTSKPHSADIKTLL
jgi:hypothetical protein